MKKLLLITLGMVFVSFNNSLSQEKILGIFDNNSDIGKNMLKGSVVFNSEKQEYLIEGSGKNMWFDMDEFHFLWKRLKGNFILRARVEFIGKGIEEHRKAGWIIRNSLKKNSAHINAAIHGDGLTSLQFRKSKGGQTEEIKSKAVSPDIIQLERKGKGYIMSVANYGDPFIRDTLYDIELNDEVYIGLFVCSHNDKVSEKALFRNLRIIIPPKAGYRPYQDYLGSNLEIMDIKNGFRKIFYSAALSLQAPNWTNNGDFLIYNSGGLLYKFDIKSKIPEELYTGFAKSNNNDHVLSFDGNQLGISNHDQESNNNSIIYTIPSKGGDPFKVTDSGPSYLHGWSPDNKYLVYTGRRNNNYNIYKISNKGGEEIQLTNTDGLDDGPEYSPDGKYIYFNSNRTGTMQIWRMKPDGTNQEQLTFDEYNDWFPHISPDGKWMVFLSFMKEVDSGDHPFYKHVYLRIKSVNGGESRSVNGGESRIIAYLYGGQGTINVPSWSPDSKRIAFISNSDYIDYIH